MRDMPERHRSIRATIDYSWQRLDSAEQTLFANLSVFRGGFTRAVAQEMLGANLRQLGRLVSKSFLQFDHPTNRYQIHTLLRQFGEEVLARGGELNNARLAHSSYFLDWIVRHEMNIKGGPKQLNTFKAIASDIENVRVAWYQSLTVGAIDIVDRALHPLILYFVGRQAWAEGVVLVQRSKQILLEIGEGKNSRFWHRLAARHMRPREPQLPELKMARQAAIERNEHFEIAYSTLLLGHAYSWVKRPYGAAQPEESNIAIQLTTEAVETFTMLKDNFHTAFTRNLLGYRYLQTDAVEAAKQARISLDLFSELGDQVFRARVHQAYAEASWMIGHFGECGEHIDLSTKVYSHIGANNIWVLYTSFHIYLELLRGEFELVVQIARATEFDSDDPMFFLPDIAGLAALVSSRYRDAIGIFKIGLIRLC